MYAYLGARARAGVLFLFCFFCVLPLPLQASSRSQGNTIVSSLLRCDNTIKVIRRDNTMTTNRTPYIYQWLGSEESYGTPI